MCDKNKKQNNTENSAGAKASSACIVSPLVIAFVQGAKWWEYHKEKATMWQADRNLAEKEALKRTKNKTLGKLPKHR